jgi:malonyl-CoA O-methyltransferase
MSLSKNIGWSPVEYAESSVLAREAGEEMFSRLEWMTLKPRVIVDLGCGTGEMSRKLQERYQDARVISLDSSEDMIEYAKQHHASRLCLCADAASLPLPNQSVDLLFANLLLPFQQDISSLLRECRRVLRPHGLLMFTAFGPDTLREIELPVIPGFIDMHDAGDLLLQLKFADPVLDVNYYTLTYREQAKLLKELHVTGMLHEIKSANIPQKEEGKWEVTYEVIFAHAFVPEITASEDGTVRIPVSSLRRTHFTKT